MCDVTTGLLIGGAAVNAGLGIGSDVMGYDAQQDLARENARAAREAAELQQQQLSLQSRQKAQNASRSVFMADLEARQADAISRVSAGEQGVAGASVNAILSDINRQRLQARTDEEQNLESFGQQTYMERLGIEAQKRSRINAVGSPSGTALGIGIGGRVLGGATTVFGKLPPKVS